MGNTHRYYLSRYVAIYGNWAPTEAEFPDHILLLQSTRLGTRGSFDRKILRNRHMEQTCRPLSHAY